MEFVRKRDGRLQKFDQNRITIAIVKAFNAMGINGSDTPTQLSDRVVSTLYKTFGDDGVPAVEEIQDVVENTVMEAGFYEVARAYILYREQRKNVRELAFLLEGGDMVCDYVERSDWMVNENANVDYSVQGLNIYLTSKVIGPYWLTRVYPPEIRKAHHGGDLHIHNLGILGSYCAGWDLEQVLGEGFPKGVAGKTTSRPPKHFRVALKQLMNFMFTLQGETAGAQAFSNFDTLLAPFVAYDHMSHQEVKQCMQEFLYDMNVGTRQGAQTPFTNITLDRTIPKFRADEYPLIGGKPIDDTYSEFQDEVDMFNIALAECFGEGDANGRVFAFPIPTYNITPDFDWDFPEFWEMVAKYGVPYFSNMINTDLKPEDVRSMCCRLRIDNRELRKRGGGFFGANPLTGSIGVVTLDLPRLGYLSKDDSEFFERLSTLMDTARQSLVLKRKALEKFTDAGLYPYSKHWLKHIHDAFGEWWKNHFSTIGIIGMNECCLNFLGEGIVTDQGVSFAEKALLFMREQLSDFQELDDTIYNLEATPAESTCRRLAFIDKERYSDIIVANEKFLSEGHTPFYTNSSHLPVDSGLGIWEALKHQDRLQSLYTGGTVFHTFIGERNPYPEGIKKLVQRIANGFHVPYYTITPTHSICPSHGYMSGEFPICPECGKTCEVYSRITGYFRPVSLWNDGKKSEFKLRKLFDISE